MIAATRGCGDARRINVHVYTTLFKHESRILKETHSLVTNGVFTRVIVVALWEPGLPAWEAIDEKREVWRIKLRWRGAGLVGKLLRFAEFYWRTLLALRRLRVHTINSHSLALLPLGVIVKAFFGAYLVYDPHELETETLESTGVRRMGAKATEALLIDYADAVVVVSSSIHQWYRRRYRPKSLALVRNIPYNDSTSVPDRSVLRARFGLSGQDLLFLHQGILAPGRGVEVLLEAWRSVSPNAHLVFMGGGVLREKVLEASRKQANVHYHPAVPVDEVRRYTASADVGFSLLSPTCLNHFYALPNKFFEYLIAGVPVVVSDYPDMGGVVDEFQCGWKCDGTARHIGELVREIVFEIGEKRAGARRASAALGWHNEERELLAAYREIVPTGDRYPAATPRGTQSPGNWKMRVSSIALPACDSSPNAALVLGEHVFILSGWFRRMQGVASIIPAGHASRSTVWRSKDGENWECQNDRPPFDPYSAFVSYGGQLWAIGERVFSSSDGRTWREHAAPTGFQNSGRALVFENRIWFLCGADLWVSKDGREWTAVQRNCPFGVRQWPGFLVFRGRLWVIGGVRGYRASSESFLNDVWASADGVNWTLEAADAGWEARHWAGFQVYDGVIWMLGGWIRRRYLEGVEFGNLNDIWWSSDGRNWKRQPDASWSPRHAMFVWTLFDCLYIACGYSGGGRMHNDVWRWEKSPRFDGIDGPS